MERLKLRYIGEDRSMGLRKTRVYKMRGMNSGVYIYLIFNGRAVPYTISGFMANWETAEGKSLLLKHRTKDRLVRMINQEIIEQLESLKSHCEDFREDEECVWAKDVEALDKAIEALEKQESNDWTPVSERQPEDPDESVLITVNGTYKNIAFKDAVMLATYDKDEGWIIDGYQYWLTAQVTAWQPLPEPYKGESV